MKRFSHLAQRGVLIAGLAALPVVGQTPYESEREMGARGQHGMPMTEEVEVDRDYDFGWLGLFGLAGLAGLMRRRERYDTTAGAHHPKSTDRI